MNRRTFLQTTALAAAPRAASGRIPIGLNTYCLRAMKWDDRQLLDYAAGLKLDAVFLQDSLDPRTNDPAHWAEIGARAKQLNLHIETGVGALIPKTPDAFNASVKLLRDGVKRAKAMGSPLIRCVLSPDREHMPAGTVEQNMEVAVKVLRAVRSEALDAGIKIAIENHKDLQAWEMRSVIETAGKEFVGSLLDTGNPVFVLEDPMTTMETLGPVALTVHFRDSVIYETRRGVAVQWVPLGEGVINFRAIVARMKQVCPPVYVYIKPITGRPPQVIPYLEPDYWKLFPKARASELARFLSIAKAGRPYEGHMVIEDLPGRATPEPFIAAIQYQQRDHMERSIEYARKVLGLG